MALQGFIDEVTGHGRVLGWACRAGRVERLHVGVFHEGRLVAEAIAHHYRADLLAAGMALGHCAFDGRLRAALAPGEHRLDLALLGVATGLKSFMVKVAEPEAAAPPPVVRAQWNDADILANLERFGLAGQLAALGPERFADHVYQWLHGRWAEPEVQHMVRSALADGGFDPEAFVREILSSTERREKSEPPASPFDGRFPFVYLQDSPPCHERPAAAAAAAAAPPPRRAPRRKPR